MVSIQSARALIEEARAAILVLMMDGDEDHGLSEEWPDLMFHAYTQLKFVDETLDQAELS